ncbi:hypothetical protein Ancab_022014 [Ancistrocladus abbreviatus]
MASSKRRQRLVLLAKQAGSSREIVAIMKGVAVLHVELTVEERELLYCGYKHMVDCRRDMWQYLKRKHECEGNDLVVKIDKKLPTPREVELELSDICVEVIRLLEEHLIPYTLTSESTVVYYRWKADFYRYSAEIKDGYEREQVADYSFEAYKMATNLAEAALSPAHPTRLGVVMNFAVFYHDIMKSPLRARNLAHQAYEEALLELHTLDEESYEVSISRLQLLRHSLAFWDCEIPAIIELIDDVGDCLNILLQAACGWASSAYFTRIAKNIMVLFCWSTSIYK